MRNLLFASLAFLVVVPSVYADEKKEAVPYEQLKESEKKELNKTLNHFLAVCEEAEDPESCKKQFGKVEDMTVVKPKGTEYKSTVIEKGE